MTLATLPTLDLRAMLRYRRPARSRTEREFIARYLDTVPGMFSDAYGNRILVCAESRTMISVHTDTVHRQDGFQRLARARKGILTLSSNAPSNCLGADDTAGVYAALRMIKAGVKATFVFHRDEEVGGRGSKWLADNYREWLATFDRCIALDRRGTCDVITHQAWGRCCSDEFAVVLGAALAMEHMPSSHGIFTDSANYVGIIPECTNVSVGYEHEHTAKESLNVVYLERLIERLCAVDFDALPTVPWVDEDRAASMGIESWGSDNDCEYCLEPCADLYVTDDQYLVCKRCWEYFRDDELEAASHTSAHSNHVKSVTV